MTAGPAPDPAVATGPRVRFVPERRLAAAVALTAPLWLLPGSIGVVLGGGALALVALCAGLDLIRLPPRSAIRVARDAPSTVGLADPSGGAYVVSSAWSRDVLLDLSDALPPTVPGGIGRTRVALAPAATTRIPFALEGRRRGRWPMGPIGGRARTRLGLVGARFVFDPADEVVVVPSMRELRRFRLLAMQHRLELAGVRVLRRRGEGQAFAALREYALGDDPRHVDWKATAKRSKLITREFTIERSQSVLTLIDAGRGMTQIADALPRFEYALSSALVLTDIAAGAGDRVGTLVFDDEIRSYVPAQRARAGVEAVRGALARVVATPREPDYAAAFRFLAIRQRKRALVVFFTDVIDARASRALIAHATHSAARHLVLVVALRNDDVFAAASAGSDADADAEQLYRRAAAEEVIVAREEALERMRRSGVVVLDVSPRQMTVGVVNRYLELKSRGAL